MRRLVMAASAAILASGAAMAASDGYLNRFEGQWSGSGMVQQNADESAHDVTCKATGTSSETRVSVNGTCRALLIFSRDIGVELKLDPASGRYTGTYIGSTLGTAQLSGTRDGSTLNLVVTWPKELNGDRTSHMTISHGGSSRFEVRMVDKLSAEGPTATTTALNFERQ